MKSESIIIMEEVRLVAEMRSARTCLERHVMVWMVLKWLR